MKTTSLRLVILFVVTALIGYLEPSVFVYPRHYPAQSKLSSDVVQFIAIFAMVC